MLLKKNIYNKTGIWFKIRRISTGYNWVTTYDGSFKSRGTAIIVISEVLYRAITIGQEFRNLGRLSWIILQIKNNVRTIIITTYCPTVSNIAGGAYLHQWEALIAMEIQNDPRTQSWIDLNTDILKLIHQVELIILMGNWNSEASEVNKCMEIQQLANKICNLRRYSNDLITYQQLK